MLRKTYEKLEMNFFDFEDLTCKYPTTSEKILKNFHFLESKREPKEHLNRFHPNESLLKRMKLQDRYERASYNSSVVLCELQNEVHVRFVFRYQLLISFQFNSLNMLCATTVG
jgi:hypothetical protein